VSAKPAYMLVSSMHTHDIFSWFSVKSLTHCFRWNISHIYHCYKINSQRIVSQQLTLKIMSTQDADRRETSDRKQRKHASAYAVSACCTSVTAFKQHILVQSNSSNLYYNYYIIKHNVPKQVQTAQVNMRSSSFSFGSLVCSTGWFCTIITQ